MDFEKLEVWKLSTRLSIEIYRGMRTFGISDSRIRLPVHPSPYPATSPRV